MSKADFSQIAEDHASLLVLVRPLGCCLKPKTFNRLFERISQLNFFSVPKPHRNVRFKYKRSYTKEDSSWGSFQAHRKVLGLITIGKCSDDDGDEVEICSTDHSPRKSRGLETKASLVSLHQQTAELYEDTLLDSILIILDSSYVFDRESTPDAVDAESVSFPWANGDTNVKLQSDGTCIFSCSDDEVFQNGPRNSKTMNGEMSASHVWFFKGESDCNELETRMQDFFNSLFWVLESKRMDRSQERSDNILLLMAPPEREAALPVDVESRAYKKKCLGRYKKHLGDLSLLAGIPGEASLHYQTCLDTLKGTNDWLWIAGAQEGLAVASYLILKPKSARPSVQNFSRNVSFSSKRLPSRSRDSSLAATLQAAATSTLQSGLDLANNRVTTSVTTEILHEDILTNYKEAIVNYSKIKESSIIEMEASLKACRILAMYRRILDASDFLQNVVKINAQLTEEEKIEQFTILAGLYTELGLRRKSAFYSRVAAMVCVAPSGRRDSWPLCYDLLRQALPGFGLSLDYRDTIESPDNPIGWPSIKLRVMHELMYSRRRIGEPTASIRHISLLLHSMFEHLSPTERVELCTMLQSYASKYHSSPSSMALEDGTILPPVPLTKVLVPRSFQVLELPLSHRLYKFERDKIERQDQGAKLSHPFIYSPFINSQLEESDKTADKNKEITWIEGNTAHVSLNFSNSLPICIQVDGLDLLVEGMEGVEVQSTSFSMIPMVDSMEVMVPVTPHSVGEFCIVGYSWEVFGVKSIIRFKEIRQTLKKMRGISSTSGVLHLSTFEDKYSVKVKPRLPYLQTVLSSTLMTAESTKEHDDSSPTGSLVIYAGQRHNFKVILCNLESIPIERIDLIKSSDDLDEDLLDRQIQCLNEEILVGGLPLPPGNNLELEFQVDGLMDFVVREAGRDEEPCMSKFSIQNQLQRREMLIKCLQKHISPGGTLKTDLTLSFQYTGGEGKDSCRQSTVVIPLFILSSISILGWKVLPRESSASVTLALELKNSAELAVEILMGGRESEVISMEPCQTMWIHCHLKKMTNDFQTTQTDPSLEGFNLLDINCEGYREQLVEHLRNCLDLRWKMPMIDAEGRISLDDIPFSPHECFMLQKSLLTWEVVLNDEALSEPLAIEPIALECNEMRINFKNETDFKFYDFEMDLSLEEGDREPVESLILIGSSRTIQDTIKPGEVVHHLFSILSTRSSVNRLVFDCRATSYSHPLDGSPFLLSMSSSPSTVLPASSSMTLTNSSSTEQVVRSDSHHVDQVEGDYNSNAQPLNGKTHMEDNHSKQDAQNPEVSGDLLSDGEKDPGIVEGRTSEHKGSVAINDSKEEPTDRSSSSPADSGNLLSMTTSDLLKASGDVTKECVPSLLTKEESEGNFSKRVGIVHRWSFVVNVRSRFIRDKSFDEDEDDADDDDDDAIDENRDVDDSIEQCSRL